MSKFIIEDVIEEFMDEDSIEQDIHHHPVSWCIALLIVTPPLVAALMQMDEPRTDPALDSLGPLQSIVGLVMFMMLQTQLFIAPIACFALAFRRHLAPAVLVAMGSSAIMLTLDISTPSTGVGSEPNCTSRESLVLWAGSLETRRTR